MVTSRRSSGKAKTSAATKLATAKAASAKAAKATAAKATAAKATAAKATAANDPSLAIFDKPVKGAMFTRPGRSAKAARPGRSAKAARPAKAAKPSEPAEPAEPARPAKAAKAAKAIKTSGKPLRGKGGNPAKAAAVISLTTPISEVEGAAESAVSGELIEVRRIHRRDINRVWEFLKISFRDVNSETVEYQRPRSKHRFEEIYEEEGVQQLLFEVGNQIVAYAECTYEVIGSDNWINPRYFEKRDMRPMFIDELAVHPDWHGRGVGSFVLEQLHHLARVNGLSHLVLEVAENNENALAWYKKRAFRRLDAAIFMACALDFEPELLPPRALPSAPPSSDK